jgi:hypothetical protein
MKKKAIIAVIILALLYVFGFRLAHPNDGLTSAMGSAKSGLVVYKGATEFKKGDKIVFHFKNSISPDSVYLGVVITSDQTGIGVDAKNIVTQINTADIKTTVKGKMLLVIPFFGTILGFVGL